MVKSLRIHLLGCCLKILWFLSDSNKSLTLPCSPSLIYFQPQVSTMCRYQQKFSESQGGRKEGHRIQYLPSPSSDSLDNHGRTEVSGVTGLGWGNNVTWSPPWGAWWWWWCDQCSTGHMCNVYCVLCSPHTRGQFVGDCRCDNMWTLAQFSGKTQIGKLPTILMCKKLCCLWCLNIKF